MVHFLQRIGELIAFFANAKSCIVERPDGLSCPAVRQKQPMIEELPFTLDALRQAYADGLRPEAVLAEAFRRLDAAADPGIFHP